MSSSDRDRQSSRGDAVKSKTVSNKALAAKKGSEHQKPSRVNMKLVQQLMKENFKQLRSKEQAEDMSRRKMQNEALQN